ncbi:MAG: hypothetical protein IPO25_21645 [Saprospiraceae bacterium]|nr:hypothetical protein [Saprospiraceae bacterium]
MARLINLSSTKFVFSPINTLFILKSNQFLLRPLDRKHLSQISLSIGATEPLCRVPVGPFSLTAIIFLQVKLDPNEPRKTKGTHAHPPGGLATLTFLIRRWREHQIAVSIIPPSAL